MNSCGSKFKTFRKLKKGIERKLDKGGQKLQASAYKIHKFKGGNVQDDVIVSIAVWYMKVVNRF